MPTPCDEKSKLCPNWDGGSKLPVCGKFLDYLARASDYLARGHLPGNEAAEVDGNTPTLRAITLRAMRDVPFAGKIRTHDTWIII